MLYFKLYKCFEYEVICKKIIKYYKTTTIYRYKKSFKRLLFKIENASMVLQGFYYSTSLIDME